MSGEKANSRFLSRDSICDNLVVVLVAARNPLNIGAAARAMANFGFSRLRVVNPYEVAFREAKSAVGASALLKRAEEFPSLAQAIADCGLVVGTTAARDRELNHPLRDLSQGGVIIRKKLRSGRVALLFGSEKRGLSNHDFSYCHWLIRISVRPDQPSMNLGQAVAVCLYELSRSTQTNVGTSTTSADHPAAEAADLDRLTSALIESLRLSGYTTSVKEDEQKLRRLIRRLNPCAADSHLFLGMLRQMLWKMRRGLAR